jgi:flagellar capping protein FliD
MATSSSSILSALGAGSGIDVRKLADDLVAAERVPRQERIEARLAKSEARISGYGAVRFALSSLRSAFADLKDAADFPGPEDASRIQKVTDKVKSLVAAYNEGQDTLKILGDRGSDVEEFGGSLAGDSLLFTVRSELRAAMSQALAVPGNTLSAARLGLEFDRDGVLQFDEDKLRTALAADFDAVALMFRHSASEADLAAGQTHGLAVSAVQRLDAMLARSGAITRQTTNAQQDVARQKAELERLEERMTRLLERYTRQFSVVESLVGNATSLRTGLASSFEGLMAMYKR